MEEGKNLKNLREYEYGALRELENIGIGNSATSLYKLTNNLVQTRVLGAKFELIENIPKITGISEFPVLGSFMHIEKDLSGYILIFFPEKSVKNLSIILSGEDRGIDSVDTISRSLIEEVSHILAGTYVTALSTFLGLNILISTPYTVYDMFGSILNSVLTEMSCKTDFALLLDAEFLIKEEKIYGNVLTLFDPASLEYILKRIDEIFPRKSA
ncbi:chemotaxis protein CheC [Methanosarcina sp. MSH10X1]|uniref:chemotaxis protein CheC n=1 Tax=Methanosarcina sp. MSH10X1 TaxID=2507075 RepID=UPI000FFB1F03|nr:chemotaxis protein CheC [Methanosarcina sp. MSH10X1]RXA18733.1 chemotaxis protein CheC [Methanosarcina sp. MSH10X1]